MKQLLAIIEIFKVVSSKNKIEERYKIIEKKCFITTKFVVNVIKNASLHYASLHISCI